MTATLVEAESGDPAGSNFLPQVRKRSSTAPSLTDVIVGDCFVDWVQGVDDLKALNRSYPDLARIACNRIQLEIMLGRGHAIKNPRLIDEIVYTYLCEVTGKLLRGEEPD